MLNGAANDHSTPATHPAPAAEMVATAQVDQGHAHQNETGDFGGQNEGENFGGHDAEILVGKKSMPTKTTSSAHQKKRAKRKAMPTKKNKRPNGPMPTKKQGWIEFPKKGTKNPKRYAYRRRWIPNGRGGWKKSKPKRIKSIPPMKESDYVKYKAKLEKAKKQREQRGGAD